MALSLTLPGIDRGPSPAAKAGAILAGAGVLAVGAFAAYFLQERSQEEAGHETIERDGDFSLRRYEPLTVAQVTRSGSIHESMNRAFQPLADYIFAKPGGRRESDDRKIAMTVPVSAAPKDGEWTVRFGMPRDRDRSDLPVPGKDVEISEVPARTVAAIRFSGRSTDNELLARKKAELREWIADRGLEAIGDPEFAGYNAPIVPGPLRRNEWWVTVRDPEPVLPGHA